MRSTSAYAGRPRPRAALPIANARRARRSPRSRHERANGAATGGSETRRQQATDRDELLLVVRRVEPRDADSLAALGGVHEQPVAEVDADVRELRLVLEEHEITGVRVRERDLVRSPELILGRPR